LRCWLACAIVLLGWGDSWVLGKWKTESAHPAELCI
jgi:hypothetical protein